MEKSTVTSFSLLFGLSFSPSNWHSMLHSSDGRRVYLLVDEGIWVPLVEKLCKNQKVLLSNKEYFIQNSKVLS
jgi:hypothetical protein